MHTKRFPMTPKNAIVDHNEIWKMVAARGSSRYGDRVNDEGCVISSFVRLADDALTVALPRTAIVDLKEGQML